MEANKNWNYGYTFIIFCLAKYTSSCLTLKKKITPPETSGSLS
jgi:hypothetical protein